MFDTKLANSIQQDYRQAADTHRLIRASGAAVYRARRVQFIVLLGTLLTTLLLIF